MLETPQGTFELLRHPLRERSTLRAWDAADAYALRHLAETPITGPVGLINDGFGALAAGLHELQPSVVVDTAMSEIGIAANLERNGLAPAEVHADVGALPDGLGLVVVKVPKSLGQLEEQLHELRLKLSPNSVVLGAGMARHIHTSTLELFERIIGPTTTSLAEQKARLIHTAVDRGLQVPANPWPVTWKHSGLTVSNHGGVFSASSVDVGTRFLLENLPVTSASEIDEAVRLVDLGCGNGIVGTAVASADPTANVVFIDASARAIDSTKRTWQSNLGSRPAEFHRCDRMVNVVERSSIDLVVNNPPFHDERAVGDATAWDMFVDSHTVLRPGGELRVVGNRQLGHHARLQKIFGNYETVASNKKFVILSAQKR